MTIPDVFGRLRAAAGAAGAESSDFDLNPEFRPAGVKLRPAGVLVPVIAGPNGAEVILTKRSSALKHHPGQIAFPGGKVDPGDDGPVGAALREAHEEIGLDPANVEVLGTLPPHETVTSFRVTPVLARIRDEFTEIPEPGEVEEVFRVPFAHVTDPSRFQIQSRRWQGRSRSYFVVPYGPYYIWGATARMLRVLAERLA
ncbi:CoA pyrophosphatase [Psychromarinibacter sp. S121]|uniref:CoA pyrophosphatase n=1 Tax=Psychromarinibacter sp. S121 TaxID=3415127 RepID=UPI003C7D96D2